MSAILLLLHLLPPSAQGRKRPGKMSAFQAMDHLIRFVKVVLNSCLNIKIKKNQSLHFYNSKFDSVCYSFRNLPPNVFVLCVLFF